MSEKSVSKKPKAKRPRCPDCKGYLFIERKADHSDNRISNCYPEGYLAQPPKTTAQMITYLNAIAKDDEIDTFHVGNFEIVCMKCGKRW